MAWLRYDVAEEAETYRDWQRLRRHGAWPVSGGILDQAPALIEAVDLLDAEEDERNARGAQPNNHGPGR